MARTPPPPEAEHRLPTLEVFVLALSVILMEVGYTRIFSFKLVYYFAYLVIGIGLLGLGAGGIFVATSERLKGASVRATLLGCSLFAAAAVLVGYLVVAEMPLNLFFMVRTIARGEIGPAAWEAGKLLVVCGLLSAPFLAVGVALAKVFGTHSERIGFLYGADLVGAALGCMIVVPALVWLTPPGTVLLSAAGFALAGLRPALAGSRAAVGATASLFAVAVLGVLVADRLPDPLPDQIKGRGKRIESVFTRWHPVFRVDVMPLVPGSPPVHFLIHDGTPGSSMRGHDGDQASLARYDRDERAYPFRMLPPKPRVAIVGSAGGNEILAALHFDASAITGIELNPVTVSLLTEHFAEFTGHLARDPRVTLVNAEGRSFLASSDATYDLVWLVAPDSYAAMNAATSGAFVLSESYLYTEEMILEAIEHLSGDGILAAQFGEIEYETKPNRTLRYLATAREAFRALGIDDFARHVLVAVSPYGRLDTTTVLLRKKPFTAEDAARFARIATLPEGSRAAYPAAGERTLLASVIELEGDALERFHDGYAYDVRPIDDDSPFFWNFVRFRDLLAGADLAVNIEEGVGERLAIALLVLSVVFAAVLLATPIVASRRVWAAIPYKRRAIVYFGALGLGFMFLEISLIQRLTLLLGYPTYSLTVTLFAILVSSGAGSLASERWRAPRNAGFVALLAVLAGLVALYAFLLPLLGRHGIGWSFPLRVAAAIALVAPLGLALGCFMPFGIRTVSATTVHAEEYVAWCWAVNGFFSVVGSVLATLLAMAYGFTSVMGLGLLVYAAGVAALWRLPDVPPPRVAA